MLAISMKIAYLKFHSNLPGVKLLTHWGWVTHICISKMTIISSDNGLSPDRCQAIISSIAGILLVWLMGTNFSEVLTIIYLFSLKKMHLKMLSVKSRPFCLSLNVLISAWICPKQKLLTILIYNSHPILMQFSCNNRWDFQKCPCNSHLQFSSNSHQTILIQFSPTILIQFSPTILIQFSPDNSHPIFTWQFSSNFHLTILIQFSPTILTQFSSTLLSQFSPTMLSQFSRNDQPICSHQSCCYFYSMLIL